MAGYPGWTIDRAEPHGSEGGWRPSVERRREGG